MVRHVISGVMGFRASWRPIGGRMLLSLVAVRTLHFWSVAILFGGGGFLVLLGRGRVPRGGVVLRWAAIAGAMTGAAWFGLTFVNVTGGAENLLQQDAWWAFLASPFGPAWAVQLALGFGAIALCVRPRPLPLMLVGAGLAVDQAWLGHAAAGTGALGITMLASYAAHVLAVFGWIGALTILCLTFGRPETTRDGLALFSTLGLLMVAAILASGCFNAALHISHLSDLTATTYGRIVLVKVVLFAVMLGLAAFNRRERRNTAMRGVALSVAIETVLGLIVLGAAALLGVTAPST